MDMTLPCADGYVNLRVGAILIRDGKFLMVGNEGSDYLYSVGGRIRFGETAEEAVVREVWEETGAHLSVQHLGFVHENYFVGDSGSVLGKTIYEVSFYFYMEVPEDFAPRQQSFTEDGRREYLAWASPDDLRTIYPAFFRTELCKAQAGVRHIVTDERK